MGVKLRIDSGDILVVVLIALGLAAAGWITYARVKLVCGIGEIVIHTANIEQPFACVKGYVPPAM